MLYIAMICNLGMSTSMLIEKMKNYALSKGIETDIDAIAYDKLAGRIEKTDIILIGPQIRHHLKKYREQYGDKVPVINLMNMSDYALLKVDKIFDEAYAEYITKTTKS